MLIDMMLNTNMQYFIEKEILHTIKVCFIILRNMT